MLARRRALGVPASTSADHHDHWILPAAEAMHWSHWLMRSRAALRNGRKASCRGVSASRMRGQILRERSRNIASPARRPRLDQGNRGAL